MPVNVNGEWISCPECDNGSDQHQRDGLHRRQRAVHGLRPHLGVLTRHVQLVRELAEETGLAVRVRPVPQRARLVPDPRCNAWCWIVSTPAVLNLGAVNELPVVRGSSDAKEAAWMPASSFAELEAAARSRGGLYDAHRGMLADLLA